MKNYARIENGIVAEIISTENDISTLFHSDLVFEECAQQVQAGWSFISGNFTPIIITKNIEQARSEKIAQIEAAYNAAIQISVTYLGKVFQADSIAQDRLLKSLVAFGGTVPAGFFWVSLDNTAVPMSFAQLQGLSSVMMAQGWAAFQKMKTLKDQIRAATTVGAVELITW